MNRRSTRLAPLAALLASASALLLGCAEPSAVAPPAVSSEPSPVASAASSAPATAPATAAATDAVVVRVPAEETCMMNNRHMKEKQIPVEVEGRTYYGCCAMCKTKLESDAAARTGTDPVSGKPVDKATAVIGAKPNGALVYFESEWTFDAYVKAGGPPPREAAVTAPASAPVEPAAKAPPSSPPRAPAAARAPAPADPPKAPAPADPKPAAADPKPAAAPAAGHEHHAH